MRNRFAEMCASDPFKCSHPNNLFHSQLGYATNEKNVSICNSNTLSHFICPK